MGPFVAIRVKENHCLHRGVLGQQMTLILLFSCLAVIYLEHELS